MHAKLHNTNRLHNTHRLPHTNRLHSNTHTNDRAGAVDGGLQRHIGTGLAHGDRVGQRARSALVAAVVVEGHAVRSVGSTQKGDQHQQLQVPNQATAA